MASNADIDSPPSYNHDWNTIWINWLEILYEFLGSYNEFTGTLTGCTTSPTGTVRYVRQGRTVTLNIPAITGASNTTAATITGAPAEIIPDTAATCLCRVVDNGTTKLGLASIGTNGTITLYSDVTGAAFTNSGNKGAADITLTYMVK